MRITSSRSRSSISTAFRRSTRSKPSQSGKMPTRILQRVLDKMRADLATNLDLHTIAAESGYSEPFLAYLSGIDGILPAPVANAPADRRSEDPPAESFQFTDRYRARLWFSSHGHFSNISAESSE